MNEKLYWIKGDDGEEYGPVDLIELREWVIEDRAGIGTEVRSGGTDDTWKEWQDFPELVVLVAEVRARRRGAVIATMPDLQPGNLFARLAAFLLDAIILLFLVVAAWVFIAPALQVANLLKLDELQQSAGQWERILESGEPIPLGLSVIILVMLGLLIVIPLTYFTLFHGARGQTPGMKLFRLRVVDANGLTIGYRQAFFRALALGLSIYPMWGAGFLMVYFNPGKQALHDWMVQTYVVAIQLRR